MCVTMKRERGGFMIHIKRRTQIKIVMYIILLALGGTLFVINRVYDFTKSKSPSISDVQYNQLDDSIFISCEVKSSDVIDYVEIGFVCVFNISVIS